MDIDEITALARDAAELVCLTVFPDDDISLDMPDDTTLINIGGTICADDITEAQTVSRFRSRAKVHKASWTPLRQLYARQFHATVQVLRPFWAPPAVPAQAAAATGPSIKREAFKTQGKLSPRTFR